jgi:dUTP pyrophosphatase
VSEATLKVRRLNTLAHLPRYATPGASGLDLAVAIPQAITLHPGERVIVPTGLAIALPPGHEGQIRPRSGLAAQHGITLLNTPGTIDEDYRGEVKLALINLGQDPFLLEPGLRVAQLVVVPVAKVAVEEVAVLDTTWRGDGGFGHTGCH